MALDIDGIQYPWLRDLDRAAFILGALGPAEAARILADPRDFAAFCQTHRVCLDAGEVDEMKALFRA